MVAHHTLILFDMCIQHTVAYGLPIANVVPGVEEAPQLS